MFLFTLKQLENSECVVVLTNIPRESIGILCRNCTPKHLQNMYLHADDIKDIRAGLISNQILTVSRSWYLWLSCFTGNQKLLKGVRFSQVTKLCRLTKMIWKKHLLFWIVTVWKRSYVKVMFSQASVCHSVQEASLCDHHPRCIGTWVLPQYQTWDPSPTGTDI